MLVRRFCGLRLPRRGTLRGVTADAPALRCTTCDEVVVEAGAAGELSGLEIALREAVHHSERHNDGAVPGQRSWDRTRQSAR